MRLLPRTLALILAVGLVGPLDAQQVNKAKPGPTYPPVPRYAPNKISTSELQQVLRKVFPDESIETISVPNGIVLRGSIGKPQRLDTIIKIAEQFAPKVINAIHISQPTVTRFRESPVFPAATANRQLRVPAVTSSGTPIGMPVPAYAPIQKTRTKAGSLPPMRVPAGPVQDVRALRKEIQELRQDVRKLLRLMERKSTSSSKASPKASRSATIPTSSVRRPAGTRPPKPVPQILATAKVIEIDRAKARKLGLNWTALIPQGVTKPSAKSGHGPVLLNAVQARTVNRMLDGLRVTKLAKVIAEPTLVTTSGRPASFNSGYELPIIVPQTKGTVSVEYQHVGTQFKLVPVALPDGRFRMEVQLRLSSLSKDDGVQVGKIKVPNLRTRRLDTAVEMATGQTLMLHEFQSADSRTKAQDRDCILLITVSRVGQPVAPSTAANPRRPVAIPARGYRPGYSLPPASHIPLLPQSVPPGKRTAIRVVPEKATADPSDAQVLRALGTKPPTGKDARVRSVKIVKEVVADYVDPPTSLPKQGLVQVRHRHYKCTVYTGPQPGKKYAYPQAVETKVVYLDVQSVKEFKTAAKPQPPKAR